MNNATEKLEPLADDVGANIYLNAARELGLSYRLDTRIPRRCVISHRGRDLLIIGHHTSINRLSITDKSRTQRCLAQSGLPVPQFYVTALSSPRQVAPAELQEALDFAKTRYPVVIKPVRGSLGRGVHANLQDERELLVALAHYFREQKSNFLIEEYIEGTHYRVLVYQGRVIDIVQRHPIAVYGDGDSTVRELIEADRQSRMRRVPIDIKVVELLRQQGFTLDSIPPAGCRVRGSPPTPCCVA